MTTFFKKKTKRIPKPTCAPPPEPKCKIQKENASQIKKSQIEEIIKRYIAHLNTLKYSDKADNSCWTDYYNYQHEVEKEIGVSGMYGIHEIISIAWGFNRLNFVTVSEIFKALGVEVINDN